jgi:hypothetical protein
VVTGDVDLTGGLGRTLKPTIGNDPLMRDKSQNFGPPKVKEFMKENYLNNFVQATCAIKVSGPTFQVRC